ncbi:hypothetical protein D3C76_1516270 [compost metagenome]
MAVDDHHVAVHGFPEDDAFGEPGHGFLHNILQGKADQLHLLDRHVPELLRQMVNFRNQHGEIPRHKLQLEEFPTGRRPGNVGGMMHQ